MGSEVCNMECRWAQLYGCKIIGIAEKDGRHGAADFGNRKPARQPTSSGCSPRSSLWSFTGASLSRVQWSNSSLSNATDLTRGNLARCYLLFQHRQSAAALRSPRGTAA